MKSFIIIAIFIVGMCFGIVSDILFEKDKKQSYLYAYNENSNSWEKLNILDLKVTLCDNLRVGVGK